MKNSMFRRLRRSLIDAVWFVSLITAMAASCLAGDKSDSQRPDRPGWYMGRQIAPTMSASGADWLTRKSREREEAPRKLLQCLDLKPGQIVCDFGCGNGYHTLQIAHRVGPKGTVYAVDIQQEMLDLLQQRAKPRGVTNIRPILALPNDPKLPAGKFDLLLMVDVYHELFEPGSVLSAIHASLNDEGRVAVVEFREEDANVPILPLHKMSQPQVIKELTANRFKLVGQYDGLPWQHVLLFAREDSPLMEKKLKHWRPAESDESHLERP
ncbi:MAG: class I SAM-dependent methyltransferase [Planctomycetota bacterium]